MKRKILSIFLALAMAFAIFPMMAFGEDAVAKIGNTEYTSLKAALDAATSGNTVILLKDYTLTEDVTVKSGVTLLIPYGTTDDSGWGSSKDNWTGKDNETLTSNKGFNGTLYRTLTISEGSVMTVYGNILVNAVTGVKNTAYHDQDVTGGYGEIVVNGDMVVNSGGILQNCGMIEGSGMITAKNGATVIDLYIIRHWRGGSAALGAKNKNVYPMNEIDCHYIQAPLKIESGAKFKGAVKIYTSEQLGGIIPAQFNKAHFSQIDNSNGLIRLNSGAYAIKTYDKSSKISTIDIYGGANFASSSMTLSLGSFQSLKLTTSDFLFPVDGDIAMNLHDGNYEVQNNFKLLPGFKAILDSDAVLTVNSGKQLILYDVFNDQYVNGSNTSTRYDPNRPPAELIVYGGAKVINNGTLAGHVVSSNDATYSNYANFTVASNGTLTASSNEVVSVSGSTATITNPSLSFKAELWANGALSVDASSTSGAYTWLGLKSGWYNPLPILDGDLDENGTVNVSDLNMLLANYNKTGEDLVGDIDLNGTVNVSDLNTLLSNYNKTIE